MNSATSTASQENDHEDDPVSDEGSDLLGPDVTQADLTKYTNRALDGRVAHYTRERLFERDPELRDAYQIEIERTVIEINRRKMYQRAEADRVFVL